ncbi:hypothetical protein [Branchiibius sp. NY16-3462-2]|uniref:glycosyltransferase family 39 protein n=1 Tax=Branchiibius sp. NY16-3462-2 TaxID=1807500 RepID=UPI0025B8EAE8|nr:hypothetical protein [Branchiibius sp. NY16-3462-2]
MTRYRWLYVAVAVGSLALNLPWLGTISAWLDEAATRSAATRPLPDLWQLLHHQDAVSGAYYLAIHGWTSVVGDSWLSMRLPSALAAAGAAVVATATGRVVGGWAIATMTGILMVLLPGDAWAGLDARPTAFALLLVTAALWTWLKAPERPRWPTFALIAAAGWVQLTALLQLTALVERGTIRTRRFWCAAGLTVAAVVPLAIVGHRQVQQVGWIKSSLPAQLYSALIGRVADGPQSTTVAVHLTTVTNVVLAFVVLALTASAAYAVRTPTVSRLVRWAYLPALMAIAIGAVTGSSQYLSRYFASSLPAVAILAAVGLRQLNTHGRRVAAIGSITALCVPALVAQRVADGKWGEDFQSLARVIHAAPAETPVFYVGNAVSVGIAYPSDVAGHRQTPDPGGAASSASLWGPTIDVRRVVTDLRPGASLVVLPTKERSALDAVVRTDTRCAVTHSVPGKRFSIVALSCP